jgi:hypothetical protein
MERDRVVERNLDRKEKKDEIRRVKDRRMPVGDKWGAAKKIRVPKRDYSLFQKPEPKKPPYIYMMGKIKKDRMAEDRLTIEQRLPEQCDCKSQENKNNVPISQACYAFLNAHSSPHRRVPLDGMVS